MAGTTYKKCSCRDSNGARLGQQCPELRRANGTWSYRHGTWYYQLELPPNPDGTRRTPLRQGGYASQDDAEADLATARELLAIAAPGDLEGRQQIAAAMQKAVKATGTSRTRPRSAKPPGWGSTRSSRRSPSANGWTNGSPARRTCATGQRKPATSRTSGCTTSRTSATSGSVGCGSATSPQCSRRSTNSTTSSKKPAPAATPAQVLLEASAGADLLVVGSRGQGMFVDALVGSLSQHVFEHAHCPVVIMRGELATRARVA